MGTYNQVKNSEHREQKTILLTRERVQCAKSSTKTGHGIAYRYRYITAVPYTIIIR